jgi:hypothetical protein
MYLSAYICDAGHIYGVGHSEWDGVDQDHSHFNQKLVGPNAVFKTNHPKIDRRNINGRKLRHAANYACNSLQGQRENQSGDWTLFDHNLPWILSSCFICALTSS